MAGLVVLSATTLRCCSRLPIKPLYLPCYTSTTSKIRTFEHPSIFLVLTISQIQAARSLPVEERLRVCTAMKTEGNNQFLSGQPAEACHTYEQVPFLFALHVVCTSRASFVANTTTADAATTALAPAVVRRQDGCIPLSRALPFDR